MASKRRRRKLLKTFAPGVSLVQRKIEKMKKTPEGKRKFRKLIKRSTIGSPFARAVTFLPRKIAKMKKTPEGRKKLRKIIKGAAIGAGILAAGAGLAVAGPAIAGAAPGVLAGAQKFLSPDVLSKLKRRSERARQKIQEIAEEFKERAGEIGGEATPGIVPEGPFLGEVPEIAEEEKKKNFLIIIAIGALALFLFMRKK